jgi:hypothetical protein
MKNGKLAGEKQTPGTVQAAEIRARCNKLTEAQRRRLRDQAIGLYYKYVATVAGGFRYLIRPPSP